MQNAAAHLLTGTHMRDHFSPVLASLFRFTEQYTCTQKSKVFHLFVCLFVCLKQLNGIALPALTFLSSLDETKARDKPSSLIIAQHLQNQLTIEVRSIPE